MRPALHQQSESRIEFQRIYYVSAGDRIPPVPQDRFGDPVLAGQASARHLLGPYSIGYGHQPADLGVAVHQEPEVGNYHFFPALKSLVDPPVWIGIVLIVRGIVVTKLEVNVAALRCFQRRSVSNLPFEIVRGTLSTVSSRPSG